MEQGKEGRKENIEVQERAARVMIVGDNTAPRIMDKMQEH